MTILYAIKIVFVEFKQLVKPNKQFFLDEFQ